MNSRTIVAIVVVIILAVAVYAMGSGNESSNDDPNTPDVPEDPSVPETPGSQEPEGILINYGDAIEQDIVDGAAGGSECSRTNYVYYVVPFTIKNNTEDSESIYGSDAILTISSGLTFTPTSSARYSDTSLWIEPGEVFHGNWTYEIPTNYDTASVALEDSTVWDELEVYAAPERELGQTYAIFTYDVEMVQSFVSDSGSTITADSGEQFAIVHFEAENITYENGLEVLSNSILMTLGNQTLEYDSKVALHPDFELIYHVAPGFTEDITILWSVPLGTTQADIGFVWDYIPYKGIEFVHA